ncbi:MAG: hypothetical protein RIG62_17755, partial [Cyclobacteriaceae bacterium]
MLRYTLLYVFTLGCGTLPAQTASSPDSIAYHYAQTITREELQEHLQILAADDMEGRETGMPGQKKAAAYIAGYFAGLDLPAIIGDTSYYQTYPIAESEWKEPYVEIEGKRFAFLKDFYSFFRLTQPMDTSFSEITFAGYGIASEKYDDYQGLNVEHKAVMVLAGEPVSRDGQYYVTNTTNPSRFTQNLMASLGTKRSIAGIESAALVMVVDDDFEQHLRRYAIAANSPSLELQLEEKDNPSLIIISPEMAEALSGKRSLEKMQQRINKKGKPQTFTQNVAFGVNLQQNIHRLTSENV